MNLIPKKLELSGKVQPCDELAPNWEAYLKKFVDREAEQDELSEEYHILPIAEVKERKTLRNWFNTYNPLNI